MRILRRGPDTLQPRTRQAEHQTRPDFFRSKLANRPFSRPLKASQRPVGVLPGPGRRKRARPGDGTTNSNAALLAGDPVAVAVKPWGPS